MYSFDPSLCVLAPSHPGSLSRFMVHRVNLPDAAAAGEARRGLVGSKSGIAVVDSTTKRIPLLPPGSSAEVDFWLLGDDQVIVTHNNPKIRLIEEYPTLEQFASSWTLKRDAEAALGVRPGFILANVKTHGGEEQFLERMTALGIPLDEVVLLDQEAPATDRILRERRLGQIAPLSLRLSRTEPFEGLLSVLRHPATFATPRAAFFDPIGEAESSGEWVITREAVSELYELAPDIEFIVCCPSRWGRPDRMQELAEKIRNAGVRMPIVMSDIDLLLQWSEILGAWR